ncbi:hypothetical protein YC2023_081749 [Brassica napus]
MTKRRLALLLDHGLVETKDQPDTNNCGEVYNPNTQNWEPTSATTLDLPNQNSYYSSMMCFVDTDFSSSTKSSLAETEKKLWLVVRDVKGHEAISSNYLIWVTNSGQEKRVIVWWKTNYAEECETETKTGHRSVYTSLEDIITCFMQKRTQTKDQTIA